MNTNNSRRVISILEHKLDRRKITLKDITHRQGAASYLGAVEESPTEIVVYYNPSYPESVREASFVHEILHVILAHEGYPRVTIDETSSVSLPPALRNRLPNLRDRFKSAIDHPEVFRRILSQFELDTDSYFNAQVAQKLRLFERRSGEQMRRDAQYHFQRQQNIMWGTEFFYYPEKHKERISLAFKTSYQEEWESCLSLYNKVKATGFENPASCYKSALAIKSHIVEYGRARAIGQLNEMWNALEIRM